MKVSIGAIHCGKEADFDLEDFRHWCKKYDRAWLPATPKTVSLYLGARSDDLSLSSLERRLAAIASLHKEEARRHRWPRGRSERSGKGSCARKPASRMARRRLWPVTSNPLLSTSRDTPTLMTGRQRAYTYLPLRSGPPPDRLDRGESIDKSAMTAQYVSTVLKRHAESTGLNPEVYSAHSLRAGFITQAIRAGKAERRAGEHSRHASWETFNQYVEETGTFQDNPAEAIGL